MAAAVTVLDVRNLQLARDGRRVLRDISFSAARGERVVIMGASGSGKSTVLRAIAGLEPFSGDVGVTGRVGIVFQFHHLFANMTALQNVWLAPVHVHREPHAQAEARARGLLDKVGVGSRADALPHQLSGGEAQRVAIARALAVNPHLLLMDEPTASLDPARRGELAATLRELSTEGTTLVIATHDVEFARQCEARVLVLDDGRIKSTP